jgi:transcriptional regulator with XRE-family HTH domain
MLLVSLCCAKFHGTLLAMTRPHPPIGPLIRRGRERRRMTQEQLAEAVGVTARTVSSWEQGRRLPKNRTGALEEVLGVSLDGAEDPMPEPTDEWERSVLADPDLPAEWKVSLVRESRAARAEYVRLKRERRAELARQESALSDPGTRAG